MRTRFTRLLLVFLLCVGVGYGGAQAFSGRTSIKGALASAWQRVSGGNASPNPTPASTPTAAPSAVVAQGAQVVSPPDSSGLVASLPGPMGVLPVDVPVTAAADPNVIGGPPNPDILSINTPVRTDAPPSVKRVQNAQGEPYSAPIVNRRTEEARVERTPDEAPGESSTTRAELVKLEQQLSTLSGQFSALREFYSKQERTVERNGGSLRTDIITRLNSGTAADRNATDALADGDMVRLRSSLATLASAVRYLEDAKTK